MALCCRLHRVQGMPAGFFSASAQERRALSLGKGTAAAPGRAGVPLPKPTLVSASQSCRPHQPCSLPSSLSHARALPIAWLLLEPFLQTASLCVAIPPVTITQTCLFIQPCSLGVLDALTGSGTSVLVKKCPKLCLVFGSLQFECAMPWCTCFGKRASSLRLRTPTSVRTLPVSPQVRLLHPLEPWCVNLHPCRSAASAPSVKIAVSHPTVVLLPFKCLVAFC